MISEIRVWNSHTISELVPPSNVNFEMKCSEVKVKFPLQGGLAGLAAMFPPTYMNAMLQGQALGGVFAAATNVFIILLGDEPKDSAFFCFLITITFMLMTGCSLLILTLTKFFRVRC